MKLFIIVCGFLLASSGPLQAQDLTTPESAVRSLLTGFCAGDIGAAINCIENAKYSSSLDSMARAQKLNPFTYTMTNVHTQIDMDHATVSMHVTLRQGGPAVIQQFDSSIRLHRLSSSGWHIVVNKDGPFQPGKPDPVNAAVRVLAEPHAMESYLKTSRDRARLAEGCIANLTSLGTASLMLLQNHDRRYALNADSFQKFLDPYLPNRNVFRCPSDRSGAESYAFNANLVGILYTSINNPTTLVAIYEGRGGKLHFKHDGKAGVVFADGHVKMVSEDEAKALRWEP